MKRLNKVVNRQRTIVGILLRELSRKMVIIIKKMHQQRRHDKNKVYSLHAPEVSCISKGKARVKHEFGTKVSIAYSMGCGLIVGARSFPENPYDGNTLIDQLNQTEIMLENLKVKPKTICVDLGHRGKETEKHLKEAGKETIHRGKYKSLIKKQRRWLKRRQSIEPIIGHVKSDHRMGRCHLKGVQGDAIQAILCATGFNVKWLLRAIAGGKMKAPSFVRNFFSLFYDIFSRMTLTNRCVVV